MADLILLEGIQVPAALGVTAAERRMRKPKPIAGVLDHAGVRITRSQKDAS